MGRWEEERNMTTDISYADMHIALLYSRIVLSIYEYVFISYASLSMMRITQRLCPITADNSGDNDATCV